MNPKIDAYFENAPKWQQEMAELRGILLDCQLAEELKWGKPCYTFQGANVVLIIGFKEYSAFLFCKGALLKDNRGILIKAGENTQAARQIRFTSVQEIIKMKSILKAYVQEAIDVEKAGLEVSYKKGTDFALPEEFQRKLDEMPSLKTAFQALTPGRQRAYVMYFSAAKQSKTRESRIDKWTQAILDGRGMND